MKQKNREWIEAYLKNCARLNRSEHTLKNYRCDLDKFIGWFECSYNLPLYKVSSEIIGNYQSFLSTGLQKVRRTFYCTFYWNDALSWILKILTLNILKIAPIADANINSKPTAQRPMAVASRKRHLSSIKNFYEFLKQTHEDKRKIFLINPVKTKIHAIKLKDVDTVSTALLTKDEWERVKESTYLTRDRLMIYLLYWGGLRLSEVTGLKFSYFDESAMTLTFPRKGGSIHRLKLREAPKIFKELKFLKSIYTEKKTERYKGENELQRQQEQTKTGDDFIFINAKGRPYSTKTMFNKIQKILKQSKCASNVSPHSFRKACATNYYRQTKDLLMVRDYLNHRDAKVTQTYIVT